jgi:hypothetical protein
MYYRKPKHGAGRVEWNPEDKELGKQAVKNITGETDYPVEVSQSASEKIREKYAELHVKKYGSDSKYSDS